MLGRNVVIYSVIGATVVLFARAGLAMAQISPTVAPDTAITAPATPVVINVLANDTDSLGNFVPGSVSVAAPPANGTAMANGDGTVTYTPAAAFTGEDQFTYTVCDDETVVFCGSAVVTVDVTTEAPTATPTTTPAPTLDIWPVANADSAGTDQGKPVTIHILANDSDAAAAIDLTSLKVVTQPGGGTASIDTSSGVATYAPNGTFTGSDTFVYQECDLQADSHCSQATVTITVSALATATPATPLPTAVATGTPTAPAVTATPPIEIAIPKPPSTGSGSAPQSPNAMAMLLFAIVGLGAIGAAGAVVGYTRSNRAR
jgi:Bacterial Ig domain